MNKKARTGALLCDLRTSAAPVRDAFLDALFALDAAGDEPLGACLTLAAYASGAWRYAAWARMPSALFGIIFSFVPSREHLLTIDRVSRSWRHVARLPVTTTLAWHTPEDWLDEFTAYTWSQALGTPRVSRIRSLLVGRENELGLLGPVFATQLTHLCYSFASRVNVQTLEPLSHLVALRELVIDVDFLMLKGAKQWRLPCTSSGLTRLRLQHREVRRRAIHLEWHPIPTTLVGLHIEGQLLLCHPRPAPNSLPALTELKLHLGHDDECEKECRLDIAEGRAIACTFISASHSSLTYLELAWPHATSFSSITSIPHLRTLRLLSPAPPVNYISHVTEVANVTPLAALWCRLKELFLSVSYLETFAVVAPLLTRLEWLELNLDTASRISRGTLLSWLGHMPRLQWIWILHSDLPEPVSRQQVWPASRFSELCALFDE